MNSQKGFTLIELVVVIAILGILAATAMPKFMNSTTQANRAAVAGVAGGFGSAVALVRAQVEVNQIPLGGAATAQHDNIQGFGDGTVDVSNTSGYPTDTAGVNTATMTAARCVNVWNGILQNPPRVATATGAGVQYVATVVGGNCRYTYQADTGRFFDYNANTGAVTPTNN